MKQDPPGKNPIQKGDKEQPQKESGKPSFVTSTPGSKEQPQKESGKPSFVTSTPGGKEQPQKESDKPSFVTSTPGGKPTPSTKEGITKTPPTGKPAGGLEPTQSLSAEDAAEQAAKITAVKTLYSGLINQVNLSDVSDRVTRISQDVADMPADIAEIRSRGYAFRSYLEQKTEVISNQWQENQGQINHIIQEEAAALRQELAGAEAGVHKLDANPHPASTTFLESTLNGIKEKADAAENRVTGLCAAVEQEIQSTQRQLTEIKWFLDQKDEACFDFYAGEALFLAAKAEWTDNRDKPDGILYLTDQRLIFEQKEKTGGGLFKRGEMTQEVEWEIPLSAIEDVTPENKGFLGGKDMLNFTLGSGAPYSKITVEVKGGVDCKFWARQIQRMVSGDAQDERAIEADPELVEKLRSAPTACHICGGTLPAIVAGQSAVTCAYCGAVIRI
ncbi:MAG: hypothetical protein H6671_14030 [Anaerolineaceae bacterium]|nr:hypothetical protein [Anaerolineaceae bacterium]